MERQNICFFSTKNESSVIENVLKISLYNDQNALPINIDEVRHFVIEILSFFKIKTNEIIIHFISEEKTKLLHGLFFNNTDTTDCMSFPIDGIEAVSPHTLGECFINPKEALNYNKEFPYQELSRYIIHCILHLIGHEDQAVEDKLAMTALEDSGLNHAKEKKVLLTNPNPLYT